MPGQGTTSVTLLGRLRSDEPDAWTRVVRLYGPLVAYWAERGGASRADAEDLAQEVFRELAGGALATFRRDRPGDTFRGWLRGVTRIVLLRHARAEARRPHAAGGTDALNAINAVADDGPPPTLPADEADPPAERHALYRRALELVKGEFEGKTWQMFWAVTVDARSPADVAAELGVSPAAVRQAKSRVLRRLKEEVDDLID
jgi:RNA polymerase sigma-70 factor (ECF subfamily)